LLRCRAGHLVASVRLFVQSRDLSNARHIGPLAARPGGFMPQRFAIYYAPAITDLLWERAAVWLGRDPATGLSYDGAVAGIERTRLLNLTQSAGRYGFHATLKPPMA